MSGCSFCNCAQSFLGKKGRRREGRRKHSFSSHPDDELKRLIDWWIARKQCEREMFACTFFLLQMFAARTLHFYPSRSSWMYVHPSSWVIGCGKLTSLLFIYFDPRRQCTSSVHESQNRWHSERSFTSEQFISLERFGLRAPIGGLIYSPHEEESIGNSQLSPTPSFDCLGTRV